MSWLTSVFGDKPQVAKFQPLRLGREQRKSVLGNISSFEDISKLGDLYRQYMTSQQNELLPGYSDTLALGEKGSQQLLKTGEGLLGGEIPQDVQDAIQRSSAYGSISGGFAGSGMSRALTARDLGLTSLDLMRQGASMIGQGGNSAQQWAATARGDILNPASEFVSPMETANFDLQNRVLQQQSRQFGYNVTAAPDPAMAGVSNTLMGVLGMYLGGGMGGGGGGLAQAGKTSFPYNAGMSNNTGMGMGGNNSLADSWQWNATWGT